MGVQRAEAPERTAYHNSGTSNESAQLANTACNPHNFLAEEKPCPCHCMAGLDSCARGNWAMLTWLHQDLLHGTNPHHNCTSERSNTENAELSSWNESYFFPLQFAMISAWYWATSNSSSINDITTVQTCFSIPLGGSGTVSLNCIQVCARQSCRVSKDSQRKIACFIT